MLQVPLKLTVQTQALQKVKSPIYSRLSKTRLGTEMTTGNVRYREETGEVRIVVGPLIHKSFRSFMRGGHNKKILDSLCDYLLPVHLDVHVEILLQQTDRAMRLRREGVRGNCVLGQDTFL